MLPPGILYLGSNLRPLRMLFAKATADGVRVSGFLDDPALVLVTCKSATGEKRVLPLVCDHRGDISETVAVKGFQVTDVVGIPILKTRRTLYVSRSVKNADELADFYKSQGVDTLPPNDMHITVAYSKRRVDWEACGDENRDDVELEPSFRRSVKSLGSEGAVVLGVESPDLHERWDYFLTKGASWDYTEYQPHITITYSQKAVPALLAPFPGRILLGPEKFSEINEDWSPNV